MISNNAARIHVLVLRDELPGVGRRSDEPVQSEELLADEPRLRITVSRADYGAAVLAAEEHRPDLILLDGVLADPAGLVAELDETLHQTPVLVLLDEEERDRVHDCVVAGARGCLVRPVEPQALVGTIVQVHERAVRLRKQLQAEVQTSAETHKGGRLIAVRGVKGGVGSTAIAANLAVALKRQSGLRVALIDAHLFGGDVPVALDLVPQSSIADLLPHLHALDDDLFAMTMAEHASGVAVLAAPPELERADAIRAEELQGVLEAVRARYDYVVVDCSPFLDQKSLLALDLADLLLLVSTPDIVALKNAARFVQLGIQLGYSKAKMRLVINRLTTRGAIPKADFEKHISYRMSFGIPDDYAVARALAGGEPLITFRRSSRAARALGRLARTILTDRGWLGEASQSSKRGLSGLPLLRLLPQLGSLKRRPGAV